MRKLIVFIIASLLFSGKAVAPCDIPVQYKIMPPVQEIIETPIERPVETIAVIERSDVLIETEDDCLDRLNEADRENITVLAKMAAGEYFLIDTPEHKMQCEAVIECAMWRVMAGESRGFCATITGVVTQPWQFHGYNPENYVSEELWLFTAEVYSKAYRVMEGEDAREIGCVLPTSYLWFYGTGEVNVFRDAYEGGNVWDWSWDNPYMEGGEYCGTES